MIAINSRDNLITVSVLGEFTLADYQAFEQQVLLAIALQGGVYVLMDLRDMMSYTVDVAWEEVRFTQQHKYDFRKIAVVTRNEWSGWLTWLQRLTVDGEVQAFDDSDLATQWLQQPV